jgi:hypothetical protein
MHASCAIDRAGQGHSGRQRRQRLARLVRGVSIQAAVALGCCGPALAQESVRLLALDRAQLGSRTITLAGVTPGGQCTADAEREVTRRLAGRRGRFAGLPGLPADQGVVIVDATTVNEMVLETGCGRFDPAGLPADHAHVLAMEQAFERGQSRRTVGSAESAGAAEPSPQILANWTGSSDMRTGVISVPAGEWQIAWLAIPRAGTGELTVVVYDERDTPIHTIKTGPLSGRRLETSPVTMPAESRVYFSIAGVNVFWGLWAQVP